MFEYWMDESSASLRRVVDPPLPVLVDLNAAFSPNGAFRADKVAMRIKASGLDLAGTVPGLLYAWARCSDGSWIGLVQFAIRPRNGKGRIETRQWTAARAISRRERPERRRP